MIGPSFTVSYDDEAPHTHGKLAKLFPNAEMKSEHDDGTLVTSQH